MTGAEQAISQRHIKSHGDARTRCTKAGCRSGHKHQCRKLKASTCEPSQDIARVFCVQMQVARSQVYSEHVKALGVPLVERHHDLHTAGGMLECAAGPKHRPEGQLDCLATTGMAWHGMAWHGMATTSTARHGRTDSQPARWRGGCAVLLCLNNTAGRCPQQISNQLSVDCWSLSTGCRGRQPAWWAQAQPVSRTRGGGGGGGALLAVHQQCQPAGLSLAQTQSVASVMS